MSTGRQPRRGFRQATGNESYPFQIRFADGDRLRYAVPVPGNHGVRGGRGLGEGLLPVGVEEEGVGMYPDDDLFMVEAAMAKRRFEPVSDREERRS